MKRLLLPIFILASISLAIALLFIHTKATNLEEENITLRKRLEDFTAAQPQALSSSDANAANDATTRQTTDGELVRLRGEVTQLRRDQQQIEKLRAENHTLRAQNESRAATQSNPPSPDAALKTFPRENWTFAGFSNPESALQSALWAGASGDMAMMLAALSPDQVARMKREDNQERTDEQVAERIAKDIAKVKSYQILKSQPISETETVLTLYIDGLDGNEQTPRMSMQLVNNEWRLAGPYKGPKNGNQQ